MKRAFISLYLLIVAALLALGWGLDRLWETYQPHLAGNESLARLINDIAKTDPQLEETRQLAEILNRSERVDVTLLHEEQLTGGSLLERLRSGDPVELVDDAQNRFLYQQLAGHPYVLVIEYAQPPATLPWLKPLLALLFYGAIALVIFFWLWPLTRDLAKLEQHAQALGLNNRYDTVALHGHPTARRLGVAFNRMSDRIRELIYFQKEMTHAVSHELRTPLARMKFALEMAATSEDETRLKEQLVSVREDVSEMDILINQLLNFARLEESQPQLNQTPGDMYSMIQDLVQRLSKGASSNKRVRVSDQSGEAFVCDWPLMERALLNLVQNALRYCQHEVQVTLVSTEKYYCVRVDDDGPGIPPAERERIFHSFTRLREVPDTDSAGFGLGLAIVMRVIQWHGGTARVVGSPLKGARFVVEWPKTLCKP